MPKLIRTEKTSWGGNKYVYACDICGAEVWYWHNRPNQNKICCKCVKERDKKKAQERAIAHDKQIRADAIKPFEDIYNRNIALDYDRPTMPMLMNFWNEFKMQINKAEQLKEHENE